MRWLSGLMMIFCFCLMMEGVSRVSAESLPESAPTESVTRETIPSQSASPYRFDPVLRGASRSVQSVVLFPVSAEATSSNPTSLVLPGMSEVKGIDLYTAEMTARLRSSQSPVERGDQAIFRFSLADSLEKASRGNTAASTESLPFKPALSFSRFELKPIIRSR